MKKRVSPAKYPTLETVLALMAFTRTDWVNKVRQRLEGALGEYAKQKFSEAIGYTAWDWNDEVDTILERVREWMDPGKTKVNFDRKKAFKEAYGDARGSYDQIVAARNDLIRFHRLTDEQFQKLRTIKLNDNALLEEMVKKFLS